MGLLMEHESGYEDYEDVFETNTREYEDEYLDSDE
jgi:hypothetical protein